MPVLAARRHGARDILWRVGGTGAGTADGGRDIEARFYVPDDMGQIVGRRWWVECKGRGGTLETDAVKVACNNVLADDSVDCEGGLSSAGYLRAIRDRFWNLLEYSSIERIKRIWTEREAFELRVMERFALIANEFAHGTIDERPWAGAAPAEAVLKTFQYGMFNLVYLFARIMKSGVDEGPIVKTLAP